MLYLCAQPDESYFLWQLKVMLHNFESVGIIAENVQVLIGYRPSRGINPIYLEFEKQHSYGKLFFYKDERGLVNYKSSIRPHILKKHFETYPSLTQEDICYHDCDIIFKEKINEKLLVGTTTCYVSDAGGYLNINYLNRFDGMLQQMADVVKINVEKIRLNDHHTGGAQYILKNCDAELWQAVEEDAESLFNLMNQYNKGKEKAEQIQAWCADMWALYWNLLKLDKKVEVHEELDFCWPKNDLVRWEETKIFHNAGVGPTDVGAFCKGHYLGYGPFFLDFENINEQTCTIKYIEEIRKYEQKIIEQSFNNLTLQLPFKFTKNMPITKRKEAQQNIINALSKVLDKRRVVHDEHELGIHTAICFGMGKNYFNTQERVEGLNQWLDKVFASEVIQQNHLKPQLKKIKKRLLEDCCGELSGSIVHFRHLDV